MDKLNLALPGNPRYQPGVLQQEIGYDYLYQPCIEVEIAGLQTLGDIGIIPAQDIRLLTPRLTQELMEITTTQVDQIERKITKHDIRALVRKIQEILPPQIGRWVHIPFTSYDVLDTARALMYKRVHQKVIKPILLEIIYLFAESVRKYANQLQIGRTHGQHALPITVGFWLARTLNRIMYNFVKADEYADSLVGKISGAVGAYNAQYHLQILSKCGEKSFEERVLEKLGLKPAIISSQVLPPEQMTYYLFSIAMLSSAFAQFGNDCRHLMRTEIDEIREQFEVDQDGSSTMAHKRNPINFEGLVGDWKKNKAELLKVMDTLVTEHERDLTDSRVVRDFPVMLVNLVTQMNTLLKKDKSEKSFMARIQVIEESLKRNFDLSANLVLAEPFYIALQMAGYEGDAHGLVKNLSNAAREQGIPLIEAAWQVADQKAQPDLMEFLLFQALSDIPDEVKDLLCNPSQYTGLASEKAFQIASAAEDLLNKYDYNA